MKIIKRITAFGISLMLILNMTAVSIPVSAEISDSRTYAHDGYTVEYNIKSEWTGYQNIEVKITNTGNNLLSNWAVGYNANGEINGLWNANVYGQKGTEYILSCASYNSELNPGQSANFGYTLKGDAFKLPQDIVNCAKRVDISDNFNVYYKIVGDYGKTYQAEMTIENTSDTDISGWQLSFNGNSKIDNLWNGKLLENKDGSFKVKNAENNAVISKGQKVNFNFSGTKNTDDTSADEEFTITFNNYKLTGIVIPMEFDFEAEIDPELDSDKDGIPDYIEKLIGSDINKSDTDNDGLQDGYEYFTLETDPVKTDTDDNGISDANEDFDEDGLSNLEEYKLLTDPFNKDSDCDGLTDADEVNKYKTDPLKFDTDSDIISDGDEITLGLDPNNPATHGYPDSEYTTEQSLGENSDALNYINNIEENPYTVSVDIKAAGVAENCLTAGESGYSNCILQNEAVLGIVPELSYTEGLSVKDVVINFNLDNSAVDGGLGIFDEELQGIKRYSVFKFFEDTNMLLPIETTYDEATNTVSTHVDEIGTYCLVDTEKWLNYLNTQTSSSYYEEGEDGENEPASLVFCIDTRDIINAGRFEIIRSDIKAITEEAFKKYSDIKVYLYYQTFNSNFTVENHLLKQSNTEDNYFKCYEDVETALDTLQSYPVKCKLWGYDFVAATQYMIDACDEDKIIAMYHITDDSRIVGCTDDAGELMSTVQLSKYTKKDGTVTNRIHVSLICPESDSPINKNSFVYEMAEVSGGVVYPSESDNKIIDENIKENIKKIICDNKDPRFFNLLTSTGLIDITLDTPLRRDDYYINGVKPTDTDGDGLSDWNEVDKTILCNIMKFNPNDLKRLQYENLPTFSSFKAYYDKNGENTEKSYEYVKTGIGNVQAQAKQYFNDVLESVKVLPISSNPLSYDSDGDGYLDCINNSAVTNMQDDNYIDIADPNPLKSDVIKYSLKNKNYVFVDGDNFDYKSYGGNQAAFIRENGYYSFEPDKLDNNIAERGCGLIAFCDTIIYLANSYDDKLSDIILSNEKAVDFNTYRQFVRKTTTDIVIFDELLSLTGILNFDFDNKLNSYFKDRNVNEFEVYYKERVENFVSLDMNITKNIFIWEISNQLQNDIPVPLSLNRWSNTNIYNIIEDQYYCNDFLADKPVSIGDFKYSSKVGGHAVVCTGLIIDKVTNKTMLIISTWGEKCIIDLDEFINTGNIRNGYYKIVYSGD